MSRVPAGNEPIPVQPSANIYTALAAAGFVVALLGVALLLFRGHDLGIRFFTDSF
jgi:hypothetical protein